MHVIIHVTRHQHQIPFQILRQLDIRRDFRLELDLLHGNRGIFPRDGIFHGFLLERFNLPNPVMRLSPPLVINIIVMISRRRNSRRVEIGIST